MVKSFYFKPKKLGRKQKKNIFWHKWLANLHGFANICRLSVAQTFKVMQYKKFYKVVFHKHFKFCFHKFAKKLIFTVPLVVQISIFCKLQKCWKVLKNLKLKKTIVIFEFPTLKIFYRSKWTFAKIFFINFIDFSSYIFFITFYLQFYIQKMWGFFKFPNYKIFIKTFFIFFV